MDKLKQKIKEQKASDLNPFSNKEANNPNCTAESPDISTTTRDKVANKDANDPRDSTRNNREDDDEDKYIERDREVRIDEGFDTYNTRDKRDDRRGDDRFRDPKPSIRDQDKDVERRPDEGDPNIRDQRIINLQRDGTFTGVGGSQSGSGAKEEYEAGVKEEAKFVKDVDQLELAWQMEEYEKSGNGQLDREDGQASDVWGSKRDDQGNLNDTRDRRDGNNPLLPAAVTWDLILSHPLFK